MQNASTRAIPSSYVRMHLGSVLNAVKTGKRDFIVLRNGEPIAAVIDIGIFIEKVKQGKAIESLASDISVVGIHPDELPTTVK